MKEYTTILDLNTGFCHKVYKKSIFPYEFRDVRQWKFDDEGNLTHIWLYGFPEEVELGEHLEFMGISEPRKLGKKRISSLYVPDVTRVANMYSIPVEKENKLEELLKEKFDFELDTSDSDSLNSLMFYMIQSEKAGYTELAQMIIETLYVYWGMDIEYNPKYDIKI